MQMTRRDLEVLLGQMDELAAFLFDKKLNGAGNALLDAIDVIDDALENHDVLED
jgi:hypothetical protein